MGTHNDIPPPPLFSLFNASVLMPKCPSNTCTCVIVVVPLARPRNPPLPKEPQNHPRPRASAYCWKPILFFLCFVLLFFTKEPGENCTLCYLVVDIVMLMDYAQVCNVHSALTRPFGEWDQKPPRPQMKNKGFSGPLVGGHPYGSLMGPGDLTLFLKKACRRSFGEEHVFEEPESLTL